MSTAGKALAGRTALVTGASRGIGKGIAIGLGEQGAKVLITGRRNESLQEAAALVQAAGGECEAFVVDHSSDEAVAGLFAELRSRFSTDGKKLDFLVNNAFSAVHFLISSRNVPAWKKSALNPSEEDSESNPGAVWDQVNTVGLRSNFVCATYALRQFEAQGSGVIVNISSFGGLFPMFDAAYAVGKSGVDRMTSEFARSSTSGVVCFTLYPGLVATESFMDALSKKSLGMSPREEAFATWCTESPLFVGRALAGGLVKESLLKGMHGKIVIAAELGAKVSAKDEEGKTPLSMRSLRLGVLKAIPALVHSPLRFLIPNIYIPLPFLHMFSGVLKIW